MFQGNVLGNDVAAPGPAAHGGRGRHTVGGGSGITFVIGLAHHDAGDRGRLAQTVNVAVIPRVNTAGVALAAYFEDGPHHVQGIFKLSLILEQSQQSGQLLRGEEVFFANLINTTTRDHNKFPVSGISNPAASASF